MSSDFRDDVWKRHLNQHVHHRFNCNEHLQVDHHLDLGERLSHFFRHRPSDQQLGVFACLSSDDRSRDHRACSLDYGYRCHVRLHYHLPRYFHFYLRQRHLNQHVHDRFNCNEHSQVDHHLDLGDRLHYFFRHCASDERLGVFACLSSDDRSVPNYGYGRHVRLHYNLPGELHRHFRQRHVDHHLHHGFDSVEHLQVHHHLDLGDRLSHLFRHCASDQRLGVFARLCPDG